MSLSLLVHAPSDAAPQGNAVLRGVSGGEKKRVTSAEILVGPRVRKQLTFTACCGWGGDCLRPHFVEALRAHAAQWNAPVD